MNGISRDYPTQPRPPETWADYGIDIPRGASGNVRTRCPRCNRQSSDTALSVDMERGIWLCHRCGWRGGLRSGGAEVVWSPRFDPLAERQRQRQHQRNRERIKAIGAAALPLSDPRAAPALAYLRYRGLGALVEAGDLPDDVRLHPELPYYTGRERIGRYPALVALVRRPDGRVAGLHRTYLAPDGCGKAAVPSPRKLCGAPAANAYRGAAVRLYTASHALIVAEGMETALALRLALNLPVWSCISAHGLETIGIPSAVRWIIIGADNDINATGQKSAFRLRRRLIREAGAQRIRVRVMVPEAPGDWLDALNDEGKK